jgi:PEGA domain.
MKNFFQLALALTLIFAFFSCNENAVDNNAPLKQGTVNVSSLPAGAQIILNGINTGKITPDTLLLNAGKYNIGINYDGLDTVITAEVKTESVNSLYWNIYPSYGDLSIDSDIKNADIYLNDDATGKKTPAVINKLFPGQYILKLKAGNKTTTQTVVVPRGGTENIYLSFISSVYLLSTPWNAQIIINGIPTGKSTPDSIIGLTPGNYNVTLSSYCYVDTTFLITVTEGMHFTKFVALKYDLQIQSFGDTRFYEARDSIGENRNNGLDLSTGKTYDIYGADKDKVDIYYNKNGNIVSTANSAVSTVSNTLFRIGHSELLNDGIDSPLVDAAWGVSMSEKESNYVFLYDKDGHYSKIKIIRYGWNAPGLTGQAWVDVQWIYNKRINDINF